MENIPQNTEPERYTIQIKGHLAQRWSEWFEGMTITHTEAGETILAGPVVDQSALHGLLAKLRDLNLTILAVTRVAGEPPENKTGEGEEE